jgi:hypothetical protein
MVTGKVKRGLMHENINALWTQYLNPRGESTIMQGVIYLASLNICLPGRLLVAKTLFESL